MGKFTLVAIHLCWCYTLWLVFSSSHVRSLHTQFGKYFQGLTYLVKALLGQKRGLILSGWESLSQLSGEGGGVASLYRTPCPGELLGWEPRRAALSPSVPVSPSGPPCVCLCVYPANLTSQLDQVEDASAELVGGAHGTHRAATRTFALEKRRCCGWGDFLFPFLGFFHPSSLLK